MAPLPHHCDPDSGSKRPQQHSDLDFSVSLLHSRREQCHVIRFLYRQRFQLTGLSQVFARLGLGEGGHLVELEMDAGVFEAIEVDAFAVNHTV